VLHLAIRVVPLGDTCENNSIRGAWHLAARVPRQGVWKPFALGDSCGMPGDSFYEADIVFCLLWMCVVYEALGDISRVRCWSILGVVA